MGMSMGPLRVGYCWSLEKCRRWGGSSGQRVAQRAQPPMLKSLHSTLWRTGNHGKVTVKAAEGSLDRGQKRGRETMERLRQWSRLLQDEWMNRDKWMIMQMNGSITAAGVSTDMRKGSGFHILFNCSPLPCPQHSWMASHFRTHVYLFLKYWDPELQSEQLVLRWLYLNNSLWGKCPNQLNQNPQGILK